jgi:hypothetical protein
MRATTLVKFAGLLGSEPLVDTQTIRLSAYVALCRFAQNAKRDADETDVWRVTSQSLLASVLDSHLTAAEAVPKIGVEVKRIHCCVPPSRL